MAIYDRICRSCGASFRGGPRAWYCPVCRAERAIKTARESKQRSKAGTVRRIGSTDLCLICGQPYTVKGGLQRYCSKCAKEHLQVIDRAQGREWYETNKATYNPMRYEKRRAPARPCVICGAMHPATSGLTCGNPACRRSRKNEKWREWVRNGPGGATYRERVCRKQKMKWAALTNKEKEQINAYQRTMYRLRNKSAD